MKLKQHYSEADLLETYYTQPGESMPVMMHLADCGECAARYDRLEGKVRALGACGHDEKPETFWARQRISIMRRIDGRRDRSTMIARTRRLAAAAVLTLVAAGVITWSYERDLAPSAAPPETRQATVTASLQETQTRQTTPSVAIDPWESDELRDFQSVVAWESWIENGDQSL